jgi:hypothetical protein
LRFAIRFKPQLYFVLLSLFRLPLKRGAHITLFFYFVNPYFHSVFTNFAEQSFYSGEENCLLGEGANYRHPPLSLQAFFEAFGEISEGILSPSSTTKQMHCKATNTQNLQADYSVLSRPNFLKAQTKGADKP